MMQISPEWYQKRALRCSMLAFKADGKGNFKRAKRLDDWSDRLMALAIEGFKRRGWSCN